MVMDIDNSLAIDADCAHDLSNLFPGWLILVYINYMHRLVI